MGEKKTRPLKIVEERGNSLIFQTDEWKATVQTQDDGAILLTREGGIPLLLTPAKS
jgi:lysophospholipid acyltransferase (LPLAT)-like uncharacterized protein